MHSLINTSNSASADQRLLLKDQHRICMCSNGEIHNSGFNMHEDPIVCTPKDAPMHRTSKEYAANQMQYQQLSVARA